MTFFFFFFVISGSWNPTHKGRVRYIQCRRCCDCLSGPGVIIFLISLTSPRWWMTFGFSLSSSPCFMSCSRHRSGWMSSGLRWVQKDVSLALEDIKWGAGGRRKPVVKERKPAGDSICLEGRALMSFLLLFYLSKACNWWLWTLAYQAGGQA